MRLLSTFQYSRLVYVHIALHCIAICGIAVVVAQTNVGDRDCRRLAAFVRGSHSFIGRFVRFGALATHSCVTTEQRGCEQVILNDGMEWVIDRISAKERPPGTCVPASAGSGHVVDPPGVGRRHRGSQNFSVQPIFCLLEAFTWRKLQLTCNFSAKSSTDTHS